MRDVPIGSTQNVGVSVRGGRVPDEYDSSPMLYHDKYFIISFSRLRFMPGEGGKSRKIGLQLEMGIYARDLVPDELLDLDVVLGHQIDGVLLLADAACARALDGV
jgi:hypothetical protein